MQDEPFNIVITGSGGQGNVAAAQWLGQAFLESGFQVTVGDTYGLSQRGGSVMSHVRVSGTRPFGPLVPPGCAHVVLGLEPVETLRVLLPYGNPGVVTVTNTRPVYPQDVIAGEVEYPGADRIRSALAELSAAVYWIPATETARELGQAIVANTVMLGALFGTNRMPIPESALLEVLKARIPASAWEVNRLAFVRGMELAHLQAE